eukprot:Skav216111  [mRNA]  locus=scaffold1946:114778:117067:+ [translate_table: standard]
MSGDHVIGNPFFVRFSSRGERAPGRAAPAGPNSVSWQLAQPPSSRFQLRSVFEAFGGAFESTFPMSKKTVVAKKKAQPAPATSAENGTPAPPPSATDSRVAHQLRVLETVASKGAEDEKKYSPRTERHIQQLTGVLDFYEYSRSDIAALVRRCHYDENQIQIADRANHEKEEWGTVKNKKQAKAAWIAALTTDR